MNKKPTSHAQLMASGWSQAAAWNELYPEDVPVRVAGSTKKELAHGGSAFVINNGVAVCTIVGRDGPVDLDSLEMLPDSDGSRKYPDKCIACEPMVIRDSHAPKSKRVPLELPPGWEVTQLPKPSTSATVSIELGASVRDRLTGFSGIVAAVANYLHYETRYWVVARSLDGSTASASEWLPAGVLELREEPLEHFTKPGPTLALVEPVAHVPIDPPMPRV